MTKEDCKKIFDEMSNKEQAEFLLIFGHQMTIMAREAYEFQGPGVTIPRLLRDINEMNHRVYPQALSLIFSEKPEFPNDVIFSWLIGEDKPELQRASLYAFEKALHLKNT